MVVIFQSRTDAFLICFRTGTTATVTATTATTATAMTGTMTGRIDTATRICVGMMIDTIERSEIGMMLGL